MDEQKINKYKIYEIQKRNKHHKSKSKTNGQIERKRDRQRDRHAYNSTGVRRAEHLTRQIKYRRQVSPGNLLHCCWRTKSQQPAKIHTKMNARQTITLREYSTSNGEWTHQSLRFVRVSVFFSCFFLSFQLLSERQEKHGKKHRHSHKFGRSISSLAVAGPFHWNNLPLQLRDTKRTFLEFCPLLKTRLFCRIRRRIVTVAFQSFQ